MTKIKTIVKDPNANIRDPSSVIYDSVTSTWNFWATRIPIEQGTSGYNGVIYHYYSDQLTSGWNSTGITINISSNPLAFDHHGAFTPDIMYDNTTDEWLMYYVGVPNTSSSHPAQTGLAISNTGVNGPFIKQTQLNPIMTINEIFWCVSSPPARVAEPKPFIINNRRMIYGKGVCNNFTALDGIWFSSDNKNTWNAPYTISTEYSPIINSLTTVDKKGFENVKIFLGPDGYLHLTGHNHGGNGNGCPHYISDDDNNGFKWRFVNMMNGFGEPEFEPAVVYPKGVPGDQGGVPNHMIQFVTSSEPYHIDLMNLTWIEANETNSVLFT